MSEPDYRCYQDLMMDTDKWNAIHSQHGEPSKRLNEHQPPKGTNVIYVLFCPCGAKHVLSEPEATHDQTT